MRKFLFFAMVALGLGFAACETSETPATEGGVTTDSTEVVVPADSVGTATDATVEPVPQGL